MIEILARESLSLKKFSSVEDFSQISFQILPHGQLLLSFLPKTASKIEFIIKNTAEQDWKKQNYYFEAIEKKEGIKSFPITNYYHIIDNRGDLLLIFAGKIKTDKNALFSSISHNYGKTWEQIQLISPENESWIPTGRISILEKGFHAGKLVIPIFHPDMKRVLALSSDDNGKHWNFSLFVEPNEEEEYSDQSLHYQLPGTKNGKIIELQSGEIWCICQNNQDSEILISKSTDVGHTWSEASTIKDFPADFQSDYDILNIPIKDSQKDRILIVGNVRIGSEYQLRLWQMNNNDQGFSLLWNSPEKFSHPLKFLNFIHENSHLLHIGFLTPEKEVVHIEFSL
ncbi:MAG: sialidase family protein [Promethearchaeota archaeon]